MQSMLLASGKRSVPQEHVQLQHCEQPTDIISLRQALSPFHQTCLAGGLLQRQLQRRLQSLFSSAGLLIQLDSTALQVSCRIFLTAVVFPWTAIARCLHRHGFMYLAGLVLSTCLQSTPCATLYPVQTPCVNVKILTYNELCCQHAVRCPSCKFFRLEQHQHMTIVFHFQTARLAMSTSLMHFCAGINRCSGS